jgi:DNA-directed RNA polymerase subunit E'/Rpb7
MVGRNTGRAFRLGDEVRVRVAAVDVGAGTIDFELANGTHGGSTQERRALPPAREKNARGRKVETKRRVAHKKKT